MAEGWARALAETVTPDFPVTVSSAGIETHGLNARAVRSMSRHGIDISGQRSKLLTDKMLESADLVVSVCSHADANCPLLPGHVARRHLPFPDPAQAQGDEAQITAHFDAVCLQIKQGVTDLLSELAAQQRR